MLNDLNEEFYQAYHKPTKVMVQGIRKLLYEKLESYSDNEHFKSLEHFMDVADDSDSDELPVMLYGMIADAWKKLLEFVKGTWL